MTIEADPSGGFKPIQQETYLYPTKDLKCIYIPDVEWERIKTDISNLNSFSRWQLGLGSTFLGVGLSGMYNILFLDYSGNLSLPIIILTWVVTISAILGGIGLLFMNHAINKFKSELGDRILGDMKCIEERFKRNTSQE